MKVWIGKVGEFKKRRFKIVDEHDAIVLEGRATVKGLDGMPRKLEKELLVWDERKGLR